jgi:hypothetical protein
MTEHLGYRPLPTPRAALLHVLTSCGARLIRPLIAPIMRRPLARQVREQRLAVVALCQRQIIYEDNGMDCAVADIQAMIEERRTAIERLTKQRKEWER